MNINDTLHAPSWLFAGVGAVIALAAGSFFLALLVDRFIAVNFGGVPLKATELKDLKTPALIATRLIQWLSVPILCFSYFSYEQTWTVLSIVPVYWLILSFWELYRAG